MSFCGRKAASCKQWSLLQNSLPSGPRSREAPQVSEQPLRINSFGTMRSTNLMSKHLLNNPHDVFCLKCWWGIQHSASALCHHGHCSQRAFLNFKDLLNILRSVGVHQRIQEKKNLAHNMFVSVILENHKLMFGFSPRGSKHETVMGRRSTLEFGPRKRGRTKQNKSKHLSTHCGC